jgi:hypothetical protein
MYLCVLGGGEYTYIHMVYNSFLMNDHRFVIPLQIWICQRQWIEMGSSPAPKKLSKTR